MSPATSSILVQEAAVVSRAREVLHAPELEPCVVTNQWKVGSMVRYNHLATKISRFIRDSQSHL